MLNRTINLYSRLRNQTYIFLFPIKVLNYKKTNSMNIIYYLAFIGFGFGSAFLLDRLLRAVKLI